MTLARNYGRIEPFQRENENIASYQANDIQADKKVSILLTSIGDKIYSLLRNHFAPNKAVDQSLADIESALKKLYELLKLVVAEQYFISRLVYRSNRELNPYFATQDQHSSP